MDTRQGKNKKSSLGALGKRIKDSVKKDGMGVGGFRLWISLGAAAVGFLFGGCHTVFGAYPLGVAFVSALPSFVWPALSGAALGSLTLGRGGMIYAMICVLAVFLRIIISGGSDRRNEDGGETLFSEPITLRASAALISGFVAAVYEILLGGVRLEGVLFGLVMVILSSVMTFIFAGAFCHGVGIRALIFGTKRIFDRPEEASERQRLLLFKISLTVLVALISLSLVKYDVFGIDLSFVFSGCVTLFAAKRFGALVGASVGFFSSVTVSGAFCPAFALLGIASGAVFGLGTRYATAAGGAALSLWGSYIAGMSGFLSLLPEYLISLCIIAPMLKRFEREEGDLSSGVAERSATDMVGTMALAYRSRQQLALEKIERSFKELVPLISGFLPSESTAEDYAMFLKIIEETKSNTLSDRELDTELTERLVEIPREIGFKGSVIRAFGKRKKHVICAAEDSDGTMITTPELKTEIERVSGLSFGTPTYYRRQSMAMMECETVAKYGIKAVLLSEGGRGEISGDSVGFFETDELYSYGVISDGMGSGEVAKRTADFTLEFLKRVSNSGASLDTAVHMINSVIRRQAEECSVGLDVFLFDTLSSEAAFIKSGAAASYVKRSASLYRIKSETMPVGVIKRVDAEKVKVSVKEGDIVIMTSDGICEPSSDAPWLVEYLNRDSKEDLEAYARGIIETAKKYNKKRDDMSVIVMQISKRG